MVDLEKGRDRRGRRDQARDLAPASPTATGTAQNSSTSTTSRTSRPREVPADPIVTRQLMFGYSQEDLRITLARHGRRAAAEPTGSMGNDFALAVLSDKAPRALRLLQAALRAGHEPADRPDPREGRDEPRRPRSARSRTCSTRSPEHAHQLVIAQPLLTQRRAREAAPGRPRRLLGRHARRHLAGRGGARGPGARDGAPLPRGVAS